MRSSPIKTSPELLRLLEASKNHTMTPAEREAQRRSWVIGETMLAHPEMTRAEAEALYDRVVA